MTDSSNVSGLTLQLFGVVLPSSSLFELVGPQEDSLHLMSFSGRRVHLVLALALHLLDRVSFVVGHPFSLAGWYGDSMDCDEVYTRPRTSGVNG